MTIQLESPCLAFATERLPLAIFLHASDRLRFLRCEAANRSEKLVFVFADPERLGSELELEFDRGAPVPATALFASQKFLRRKMTEILNPRKNGAYYGSSQ
jgi:hypothetical protein